MYILARGWGVRTFFVAYVTLMRNRSGDCKRRHRLNYSDRGGGGTKGKTEVDTSKSPLLEIH